MATSTEEKVGGDDGYAYVESDLGGEEKPNPSNVDDPETSPPDPKHELGAGGGAHSDIKSTILISGVAVAIIGAVFAIAKKINEG